MFRFQKPRVINSSDSGTEAEINKGKLKYKN